MFHTNMTIFWREQTRVACLGRWPFVALPLELRNDSDFTASRTLLTSCRAAHFHGSCPNGHEPCSSLSCKCLWLISLRIFWALRNVNDTTSDSAKSSSTISTLISALTRLHVPIWACLVRRDSALSPTSTDHLPVRGKPATNHSSRLQ